VTFTQEWISDNVSPPIEVPGSLATEMKKRASDEERVSYSCLVSELLL
jgi:eukaryotic translation initiation factor 2-alpha kinase 4